SWAVTTDRRNRVIVGGSLGGEGRFDARAFMVGRLNAAGRAQTWFGEDGVAIARFGKRAVVQPRQVYIDSRGRIVVAGTVAGTSIGYGLAFARFLSGRR
ncbi:MAG TPA: hypothetical protein VFZ41_03290, partial [Solirubrobacterales bacterium]